MKKNIRIYFYVFSVLLIAGNMFLGKETSASTFQDVPGQYQREISYLFTNNVITGYPNGEFRPNQAVTREEAATMIGRALKLDGTRQKTSFSDVGSESYASGYIQSAYQKGIIQGDGNGLFRPYDNMTRLEMAYLIVRAFNLNETSAVNFTDMPTNPEDAAVVNKLKTAGITNGYPGNVFMPNKSITRIEFALMVARALNAEFRTADETVKPVTKYVTADVLNVRSGPGTGYQIIGKLTYGSAILVTGQSGTWYAITYNGKTGYVSSAYVIDQPTQTTPPNQQLSKKKTIAVDAGHGGSDPGASGNGLVEKDITLDVATRLQKYLTDGGYKVVMTRNNDTYISLDERVNYAVKQGADIFISIHVNSYTGNSANGSESYYYNGGNHATESKQLATFMQKRLINELDTTNRGVKTNTYRVLKTNTIPATLVELAFITNSEDAKKLGSATYRDKAAHALYLGVIDYDNWDGNN
ncbi:N-acetylmuramoyl-L-alanine amidase [Caldifermentibacillus hisashii]|uniref:N-acetylmuramoyl-L-alanine amidase n=1 Tax=Caldifermentibacillus hisashii TaxID=996558 RepID=UPI0031B79B66